MQNTYKAEHDEDENLRFFQTSFFSSIQILKFQTFN